MAATPATVRFTPLLERGPATLRAPPKGPWVYVDEARTHQVHAEVTAEAGGFRFVIHEAAYGAAGATPLRMETPFREPWEARFHLADLEARLSGLGRYWRSEPPAAGWRFVGRNPAVPVVDLRGVDAGGRLAGTTFHPFRGRQGRDRLLVALPREGRFALADLDYAFPHVEEGALCVLHTGLHPALLRSLLAREHHTLLRRGYDKLATPGDFALAYGPGWRERIQQAFESVVDRIVRPAAPPPETAPAPAAEPENPYVDYASALADPRLAALHARHLRPGEEEALLAQGEPGIRRAIAGKRRGAPHSDQHRLSLLEASLLARSALRRRTSVDPAAARLLRRLDLLL